MERLIINTLDGSPTLYAPEIDEHYHSIKGAESESIHIFVQMGLLHAIETYGLKEVNILEIGFGTGLNALLTLNASKNLPETINYHTTELYPLSWSIVEQLYTTHTEELKSLHDAPWNTHYSITPNFTINKCHADVKKLTFEGINVVYFDAFSPEKQPDLWSESFLSRIYQQMAPNGVLTTYCAKGEIRRRLQNVGFFVERLPGPIGGKREILRATKKALRDSSVGT
ncbi:MAG: tRNA (5-methylaminomethyl-2-thiouridine)(34)-methyltransferase MnmD [Bacteroidaceae bacterium]|nr:tRNA (5-methylaminomethyl-2-thiouridine)(34)-methyltransferase MnmD [Bacteroidaceae bacterium]